MTELPKTCLPDWDVSGLPEPKPLGMRNLAGFIGPGIVMCGIQLAGGEWQVAAPEHVGSFTAVGYFFAREVRQHVDVPIGLLHTSWGGTRIEPWISAEALTVDQAALEERFRDDERRREKVIATIRERFGTLPDTDHGFKNGKAVWAEKDDGRVTREVRERPRVPVE